MGLISPKSITGKFQMTNFLNGFLREFKTPVKTNHTGKDFFLEAFSETLGTMRQVEHKRVYQ